MDLIGDPEGFQWTNNTGAAAAIVPDSRRYIGARSALSFLLAFALGGLLG